MNTLSKQISEKNFYNIGLGKVITQNWTEKFLLNCKTTWLDAGGDVLQIRVVSVTVAEIEVFQIWKWWA